MNKILTQLYSTMPENSAYVFSVVAQLEILMKMLKVGGAVGPVWHLADFNPTHQRKQID